MGGSNPILALVQLASSFSADQLVNVQQKIQELRGSMQQAVIDDQDNETQSQIDFQTLLSQFADQRTNLYTFTIICLGQTPVKKPPRS